MRISDWSSDVCSSDLEQHDRHVEVRDALDRARDLQHLGRAGDHPAELAIVARAPFGKPRILDFELAAVKGAGDDQPQLADVDRLLIEIPSRSEEHTSELQSLMRISYAVFCLNKKTKTKHK